MRTTKPVSTISYNTEAFLEGVLTELVKAHKVAFWAYIKHTAEEDEHKDHLHVYIEPNGKLDTMDLQDLLSEVDMKNPGKPLKCVDWRSSKWDDWYLYGIHYEPYLKMKFETRMYHYEKKDVKTSDTDDLENRVYRTMHSDVLKHMRIHNAMVEGMTVEKLVYNGAIAPTQAFAYANWQHMYLKGKAQIEYGFEPIDEYDVPFLEESEEKKK